MSQANETSRREFLSGLVRYGLTGGLLLGAGGLILRRAGEGANCRRQVACADCEAFSDCPLSPAVAARGGMTKDGYGGR